MRRRLVLAAALILFVPVALATWVALEETMLVSPAPAKLDKFGWACALSGDTAVVGVPQDDHGGAFTDAGAAYVYVRTAGAWSLEARLEAALPGVGDRFGHTVKIDGDTLVVGAPLHDASGFGDAGAAYVFTRSGTTWAQQAQLTEKQAVAGARFGTGIALDGETTVIGAPMGSWPALLGPGVAYVFVRSGSTWTEQATLKVKQPVVGAFGFSLDLEGDRLIVGSPDLDFTGARGAAHIFTRSGTVWNKVQTVRGRGPMGWGNQSDYFGYSVALSGDTLLVGAPFASPITWQGIIYWWTWEAGRANVYVFNGVKWHWQAGFTKLPIYEEWFGCSVDLEGNVAVIGGAGRPNWNFPIQTGKAIVYVRSGTVWTKQKTIKATKSQAEDQFGASLALEGDTLLIGAPRRKYMGFKKAGTAHVYRIAPPAPKIYCQAGTSASGCAAAMGVSGTPSASAASGFTLSATSVEGQRPGQFLFASNGKQAQPWGQGSSLLCVTPPLRRGPLLPGTGTQGACDGSFSLDLNALWCPTCPGAAMNPGEGGGVWAQLWYRDSQNTSGTGSSLSDAVVFWVEP